MGNKIASYFWKAEGVELKLMIFEHRLAETCSDLCENKTVSLHASGAARLWASAC